MLQSRTLEIYPTSRAIREELQHLLSQNSLLPKFITIGDFEKKALLVPGRTFIDEDTRTILMQQASDFANFGALQIEREFFAFMKNSQYLFSFFEELAVEKVAIEDLVLHDTYASYEEHLQILRQLRDNYIALLDAAHYVDKMTLPSLYRLNEAYLRSFSRIDLHLEGYLSRFEIEIFTEIADIVPLCIHLHAGRFNRKMVDAFSEMGFALEIGHDYILDLSAREIASARPHTPPQTNYTIAPQPGALQQVAFVKKKIYDFINEGYAPEEIVVILPRGDFATKLDLFDIENNLNFAMGFGYTTTDIYRRLDAIYSLFTERSHENRYRVQQLEIAPELLDAVAQKWSKRLTPSETEALLDALVPEAQSEAYRLYDTERTLFRKLLPTLAHYPFHKVLHLFLGRLSRLSLDDTRGGKVTVMEILETRGIAKEAVIVVDFNEGVLPNISRKDLFLSSAIREAAGLPTPVDRENLQKYYYSRIFDRAKAVAVCYIEDEQNQPSRFLEELAIHDRHRPLGDLREILFARRDPLPHYMRQTLIHPYDFSSQPLSASALRAFLDCRRKFYFRYIRKLHEFEIPKDADDERETGILLHDALHAVYRTHRHYDDRDTLMRALQRELYLRSEDRPTLRFVIDRWLETLAPFVTQEIRRFAEGYRVHSTEQTYSTPFGHLTLTGNIDRIDIRGDAYYILDYKSGKIPQTSRKGLEKESDFQLQFYYLITRSLGNVEEALYYDLRSGELVADALFDEKLDLLYTHLASLDAKEYDFTMTEDRKKCQYCPYQKICNRIL